MVIAKPARGTSTGASALQRIGSAAPRLTPTERRIADSVLEDPSRLVLRSISQVAEDLGVTQPSLSRFAKSVGFGGFRELRLAIARDIALPLASPTAGAAPTHPASELAQLAERCASAPAVEVWAGPELQSAASELAACLQTLGIPAAAEQAPSRWASRAAGVTDGTLCLLLACGSGDPVWSSGFEIARAAGLAAVVLSHGAPPRSAGAADVVYFDYSRSTLSDAGRLLEELESAVRTVTGSLLDPAHSSRRTRPALDRIGTRSDQGAGAGGTAARPHPPVVLVGAPSTAGVNHSAHSLARALLAGGFDVRLATDPADIGRLAAAAVITVDGANAAAPDLAEEYESAVVAISLGASAPADPGAASSASAVAFHRRSKDGFVASGTAEEPDLSHRNALITTWISAQLGRGEAGGLRTSSDS